MKVVHQPETKALGGAGAAAMAPLHAEPRAQGERTPQATAQSFEAVLLGQMAQLMMASAGGDDVSGQFSGGHAEEMFRGMMAEEMGRAIAARGGIGLAPAIVGEIVRLQGGPLSQPAPPGNHGAR